MKERLGLPKKAPTKPVIGRESVSSRSSTPPWVARNALPQVTAHLGSPLGTTPSPLASDFTQIPVNSVEATDRGEPLPNHIRSLVARTTGQVLDPGVRCYRGARSRASAEKLSARAFTFGQDIHVGSLGTKGETRVLLHEAIHTLQQQLGPRPERGLIIDNPGLERQASRAADVGLLGGTLRVAHRAVPLGIQCDALSSIREKLSYGVFDWEITDAEAMEAFATLAEIPAAALPAALASLGPKYVSRLLDNLPDAAKTGDVYQRIIQTIGPRGSLSYVDQLLSYGLTDWVVTDTEVTRVYNILANLSGAEQEQMLAGLERKQMLGRLIENSNAAHHRMFLMPWIKTLTNGSLTNPQRTILHRIVDESRDGPIETLVLATEKRFNVAVRPSAFETRSIPWRPQSLSETYLALELLPDAHTLGNAFVQNLGQYDKPEKDGRVTSGVFSRAQRELAINVRAPETQSTVAHETGHAVDAVIGWSAGAEPSKPSRGGWKQYFAGCRTCATDMLADSADAIQNDLTAPQRNDVIGVMAAPMLRYGPGKKDVLRDLETQIRGLPWFGALPKPRQVAVLGDKALRALEVGFDTPWFDARGGGVHLGAHVYELSYPQEWVRYEHQARARMIAPYQFRGPGEWFAVAYETYYTPDSRGKGAKLADVDPDTKLWFDAHVDPIAPTR